MFINIMREIYVPFTDNDWVQECCVGVHNVASSKNLIGRCPIKIYEGHTKDISKFRFHLWETIWYFKKCKAPEILGNQQDVWRLNDPLDKECSTTSSQMGGRLSTLSYHT